MGLSIEISREKNLIQDSNDSNNSFKYNIEENKKEKEGTVEILSSFVNSNKKLEVSDFVAYFRNRFMEMKGFLQSHSELENPISISKIFGNKQKISIIGIVSNKSFTKNKNIIFDVEDLTGRIKIIVSKDKQELYEKAEDVALDSIVGFKGSGNEERFFANDIIYPDASLSERKSSFSPI